MGKETGVLVIPGYHRGCIQISQVPWTERVPYSGSTRDSAPTNCIQDKSKVTSERNDTVCLLRRLVRCFSRDSWESVLNLSRALSIFKGSALMENGGTILEVQLDSAIWIHDGTKRNQLYCFSQSRPEFTDTVHDPVLGSEWRIKADIWQTNLYSSTDKPVQGRWSRYWLKPKSWQ